MFKILTELTGMILKRAQERRDQLWEWHDTEKKTRQVYVEPAGVWMTVE